MDYAASQYEAEEIPWPTDGWQSLVDATAFHHCGAVAGQEQGGWFRARA